MKFYGSIAAGSGRFGYVEPDPDQSPDPGFGLYSKLQGG